MSTRHPSGRHRAAPTRPARARHARAGGRHTAPRQGLNRRLAVVAAGTAVFLGGGTAVAAWMAEGSGNADAQALGAQSIVIDNLADPVADLYPGGTGDVVLRVRNPNPYAVTLDTASFGTVTGGCATGSVVPVQGTVTLADPIELTAGSAVTTIVLADAVRMLSTAPNDCQLAAFTVPVTLTGSSV